MKILIACEFSGIVRDAFAARGHNAWSCDLLPTERPGQHLEMSVFHVLNHDSSWDMMIAHPPCTYLCSSGARWWPQRQKEQRKAIDFFMAMATSHIPRIAIENPIGCMSSIFRKPDQIVQPWQFGEDAAKATCLWLKNLPGLKPTKHHSGRLIRYGNKLTVRWGNQLDSGQNKLAPSENRSKERSRTYKGIADAMAEQWSAVL